MMVGSTFSPLVSVPGLGAATAIDDPLTVFELVSAYGTVGLSLGLPTVGLLRIMGFGTS